MPPLNPDNPLFIAAVVAAVGIILVIVWLLSVLLRLFFGGDATLPPWQPAYRMNALNNPDSIAGRRQLWQQQAQSDALPLATEPGTFTARKVLIGMDGRKLGGWQINGMRIAQYDMYGRLGRTQVIFGRRSYRALNHLIRKPSAKPQEVERVAKAASRSIIRKFRRKIRRTPTLPISLDIRFRGLRGDVRVLFELQQSLGTEWALADHWEPELAFPGDTLQENYTYVLNGQRSGENAKALSRRLESELTRMLIAMVSTPPLREVAPAPVSNVAMQPVAAVTPATHPTPPVPQFIAEDTAQMQAVLSATAPPVRQSSVITEDLPTVADADGETATGNRPPDDLPPG